MMDSNINLIRAALPLHIRAVEVNDPILVMFGDEWSLTLACPWRLTFPDWSLSSESEIDIEDSCWDLVGHSIVAISAACSDAIDPVFELDGDGSIAVTADTDLDPWVLRLPLIVIVGQMSK